MVTIGDDLKNTPPAQMGEKLDTIFTHLEDDNPKIEGVFTTRFADRDSVSPSMMQNLVNHFDRQSFTNKDTPTDLLGDGV